MRSITTFFALLATALLLAAPARGERPWKRIENDYFSFSAPRSLHKTESGGIDSFYEAYKGGGIKLSVDYGYYSNDFSDWPEETRYETVTIDGRAARIGTARASDDRFPFSIQVYIELDDEITLGMFAACKSEDAVAVAKRIFESIELAVPASD